MLFSTFIAWSVLCNLLDNDNDDDNDENNHNNHNNTVAGETCV